jgi:hypothetical protein
LDLAALLDRLAELDRNPGIGSISDREQVVAAIAADIAAACDHDPHAAAKHLPTLEQALARTAQLREIALRERADIHNALQSLDSHRRQLRSFADSNGPDNGPDNGLLDRLA